MASTRPESIVLASASTARAALLRAAGIQFTVDPADIDESPLKDAARQAGHPALDCAAALAEAKAQYVSRRHRGALVIGADQILALGAEWFDKPSNLAAAGGQLRVLRARTHTLATAVCVACGGSVLWRAGSAPEMTMRRFSDRFIEGYIAAEGEALLGSVGAYRLEGRGVQLFERINGDHFAVLGLPLIELLGFLRQRGTLLA
jgi:septum formation protein